MINVAGIEWLDNAQNPVYEMAQYQEIILYFSPLHPVSVVQINIQIKSNFNADYQCDATEKARG